MRPTLLILLCIFLTISGLRAQEGTPSIIRGSEKYSLTIKLLEEDSGEIVDNTEVYLYHTKSGDLLESKVTAEGLATFEIDPQVEYEIRTCNPSYLRNGISIYECNEGDEVLCSFGADDYSFIATSGEDKPIAYFSATLKMTPLMLGSVYELENVYYDLDKATLRPRGKRELDELAEIMKRNESITIELSSHTDSRASNEYNMDLSQRRAKSCYDYLIQQGIAAERIKPKGYGETKLRNNCTDNVSCTEAEHQKNRRTEIEVLTFEEIACEPSMEMDFEVKDLENDPEAEVSK